MEEIKEELREQPQESLTLGAEEQQVKNDGTESGSLMEKFKTVDALQKAYANLEKEFTIKCQKVKELSEKLENSDKVTEEVIPEYQGENWEERVATFFAEKPEAKNYVAEISEVLSTDEEIARGKNSLENALTKVLASKFEPYSSLIQNEKFLNEYVYSNKEISDKIINNYLENISKEKSLPLMSSSSGVGTFSSPIAKPKTIGEAGKLAEEYFKN